MAINLVMRSTLAIFIEMAKAVAAAMNGSGSSGGKLPC